MTLARQISDGLSPVLDLVYPPRCPLCGDAVAQQGGLCTDCWNTIEAPGDPACRLCSLPIGSGRTLCHECEIEPPRHWGIHAATLYNDASRQLILSFKHGGKIALARLLARMMAQRFPQPEGGERHLLVPVPLHRWRLWRRGYNQAAMLVQELARSGEREALVDGLVRTKRTPSLGGLGRLARHKALRGAIAVNSARQDRIAGRHIVLVDDVMTSGATSDACVAALLDAGAASVRIACFARVVDGRGMAKNETPEVQKTPGAA